MTKLFLSPFVYQSFQSTLAFVPETVLGQQNLIIRGPSMKPFSSTLISGWLMSAIENKCSFLPADAWPQKIITLFFMADT
jgi:hypothetical protein